MRIFKNNSSTKASPGAKGGGADLQASAASPGHANVKEASVWAPAKVAHGAAITAILLGLVALAGWWLDVAALRSLWPGRPRMVPPTALMFALLGVALGLVVP